MTEEIPLEDLPKDDDNDDGDGTFYQTPNTSTSHIEYPGYDEDEGRRRAEWDIPSERRNLGGVLRERDEKYDRRREAGQELKRYLPDFNPDDATFNVTYGKDGSIIGVYSNRSNSAIHIILDKDKNLKLEDLPKGMRKELGVDYETMLEKYNNTASELKKSIEKNKELDNALQGLKATAEVYPQEISRYEEREKELREFIERQQIEKAENKSLFDQTVKQNIELKIQEKKLLDETKLYKEEIDKFKKGKSNESKLKQSNERLKSEVDKLREQIRNKTISSEEQLSDIDSRKE